MNLIKRFRGFVYHTLNAISPALQHQVSKRFSKKCWDNWGERIKQVRASPDNAFIPRVPNAGQVVDDWQIMHNGLKVQVGSYYGKGSSKLLRKNRGVHEPQEERVFQEVLKKIPPGGAILELGAYWSFYSMWFCHEVPKGRAFLVEPVAQNLAYGRTNFAANSLQGSFTQALVGPAPGVAEDGTAIISVDSFLDQHGMKSLAILHSDIQGHELDMLRGAKQSISEGRIDYFFISTHNEDLHRACLLFVQEQKLPVIASVSPAQSYSVDGVLVCQAPHIKNIGPIPVSQRPIPRR